MRNTYIFIALTLGLMAVWLAGMVGERPSDDFEAPAERFYQNETEYEPDSESDRQPPLSAVWSEDDPGWVRSVASRE